MSGRATILICSDIHYASDLEQARQGYEQKAINSWFIRLLTRIYRRCIWLDDPLVHNHLLDQVLNPPVEPDWVVANGDYSCDSAFIGVADPPARKSASIVLGKFRRRFPNKFSATFGDHELGKISLAGGKGGLRLESWQIARDELKLQPIWKVELGNYLLLSVTSSLLAMEVYEREALPGERDEWNALATQHRAEVSDAFSQIKPAQKILLFCHDPTALPFLAELPQVKERLHQIERTVIGHLHSPLFLWQSRLLSGMPCIKFCGSAIRRMSAALSRARAWKKFNLLLCPSLTGIQLLKDGGYFLAHLDLSAKEPIAFTFQRIAWT